MTQPHATRSQVKTFWLTAGALGVITTILTVTLTKCMSDKPTAAPSPTTVAEQAQPQTTTSATTTTTKPSSRFRKEPVSPLRVPYPSCYSWVDLDVPKVIDDTNDSDITYEDCSYPGSIEHFSHSSVGVGPAAEPATAEECERAANSQALSRIDKRDVQVGMTLCVVTNRGNVVWLKLTQKIGDQDTPDLAFDMVRWMS